MVRILSNDVATSLISSTGPRFRYWVPSGMIDPAVVDFDVRQIAEKGFGGAEYLE